MPEPTTPDPVAEAVAALTGPLGPLDDAVAALHRDPGLVAWWAPRTVLPDVGGSVHPVDDGLRLLDVGVATMLRNKVTRQDLYRTGVSSLRRVLAGLLLDELALAPTWAADVVLPKADEERLTTWMRAHLRLSWCVRPDRREVRAGVVAALGPALTLEQDPEPPVARAAHDRYTSAAGEKTVHVIGVPFQRP